MKALRNLALISAACLVFSGTVPVLPVLPVLAAEQSAVNTDSCGEHVSWKLDVDGTLRISGEGDMFDYVSFPVFTASQYSEAQIDRMHEGLLKKNQIDLADLPWADQKDAIKAVVVEDGVTSVGMTAFEDCKNLETIELADSVTKIGDYAFHRAESLRSLKLPKGLKSVGEYAFSLSGSVSGGLTEIVLPEGTEFIGMNAFAWCSNLESVKLPDSIQDIEIRAFEGTKWLKNRKAQDDFVIENGILLAYGARFKGDIVIPDGVRVIGGGAMEYAAYNSGGAPDVLKITIPDGVETICEFAFCWCGDALEIEIPASVTTIHDSAFFNCFALTKVNLPEGLKKIGSSAFGNCESLTAVTIPKSVTEFGADAFSRCSMLQTVTILNPEMELVPSKDNFSNPEGMEYGTFTGLIRGYAGSTAEAYAKQFERRFEAITGVPADGTAGTKGDVNCDERVDVSDAVLLARYLTADAEAVVTEAGIQHADVNGSGQPDTEDLTELLRFIAKKVTF